MTITAAMVKALRDATGAGFADCKQALIEHNGDMEKAAAWLRQKGLQTYEKKQSRVAAEGIVGSYIHAGDKIGVLVEVNCETDFVARTEVFREFVKEIAMQIAATNPRYISKEEIPQEVLEQEKAKLQAEVEGKPPAVVEKVVEGRLRKFYETVCLLDQTYIRDEDKTVDMLRKELIAKVGENVVIRRFARFHVGQMDS